MSISVILNTYKRLHVLPEQIEKIESQTLAPVEILIWNNSLTPLSLPETTIPVKTFTPSENTGVWSRFFLGFQAKGKYIAVFDDDTIPGKDWFKNCLRCIKQQDGLYGCHGYRFKYRNNYHNDRPFGWSNPNEEVREVDIIGHAWFFQKKHLKHFANDLPDLEQYKTMGEDFHLSYTLKRYGGLCSYIAPHPANNIDMYGSLPAKAMFYGLDENAISRQKGIIGRFTTAFRYYIFLLGHQLVDYPRLYTREWIHFKYEWSYFFRLMMDRTNFVLARYADGELAIMKNSSITAYASDNWSSSGPTRLGEDLRLSCQNHRSQNYYYAAVTTQNNNQYHQLKESINQEPRYFTYADIWINDNFILTRELLYPALTSGQLGQVVLLANEGAPSYVERHSCEAPILTNNPRWVTRFISYPDRIVNWWEEHRDEHLQLLKNLAQEYSGALFAVSVGPLSEVLIHYLWEANPNNRYVDFGPALDLLLKGQVTRSYMHPQSRYGKMIDKSVEVK